MTTFDLCNKLLFEDISIHAKVCNHAYQMCDHFAL